MKTLFAPLHRVASQGWIGGKWGGVGLSAVLPRPLFLLPLPPGLSSIVRSIPILMCMTLFMFSHARLPTAWVLLEGEGGEGGFDLVLLDPPRTPRVAALAAPLHQTWAFGGRGPAATVLLLCKQNAPIPPARPCFHPSFHRLIYCTRSISFKSHFRPSRIIYTRACAPGALTY